MLWEILHTDYVVIIGGIENNFLVQCSLAVYYDFRKRQIVFHNDTSILVYKIADICFQFCV